MTYPTGHFDDVRLTADAERIDAQSRYGPHLLRPGEENPSPLKRGGDALVSAGKKLRRLSVRVVNFSGAGGMLIGDQEEARRAEQDFMDLDPVVDFRGRREASEGDIKTSVGPLRGRTLGFLRPDNPLRLAMYNFLVYQQVIFYFNFSCLDRHRLRRWTEPCILLLIIVNALVLTIQAARELFITDPFPHGGLKTWEDVVLFSLFVVFTYVPLPSVFSPKV
jgi:hypothetical protein